MMLGGTIDPAIDDAREVLLTEAWLQTLAPCARKKRSYQKVDSDYWEKEIFEKRSVRDDTSSQ